MNKSELIDYIAKEHSCTKLEAERAINMFTGAVTSTLGKGEEINLIGFGTFYASKVEARKGHNPKTKEAIDIAARIQPKFRPGKVLKEACNGQK